MKAFVSRLIEIMRCLREYAGPRGADRRGMTFAEVLVMVIVAGSLMIPVVGTLQTGVERTDAYSHQDRMRTLAQSEMTRILAESAYDRKKIVDSVATITWPVDDPQPVATYIMEIKTLENIRVATLTSTIKGDFPAPENMTGTQPSNLKAVVVTVTHLADTGNEPLIAPSQIRLFSMIAVPRSFNPNRIFIADKDNYCLYAVDPLTRNVVETFGLPRPNAGDTDFNQRGRPGNLAVHPNGNWVLTQTKYDLQLTDVGLMSPTRRTSIKVYNYGTGKFLEDSTKNDTIRKDRGVAFRPDGRFCYVTSNNPSCLHILAVPDTFGSPFTLMQSIAISQDKFVDLQVGEDGYLYLGDYENPSKCFRRLNMYVPPTLVVLEDYLLPGWGSGPNKKPIAACTSRDGRDVYSIWEDGYVAISSSSAPGNWQSALIKTPTTLGGEDLPDIQVAGNNSLVAIASKKGGVNTRIYALPIPISTNTINPWAAPNTVAYPGIGDVTNQVILSPTMNEIWADRKGAGEIYALDDNGLAAGSYTSGIPTDRTITFLAGGDAGCIAAKTPEIVAVGCMGGPVEFIDPYSMYLFDDLRQGLPYTPVRIAYNGAGSNLSACYDQANTFPAELDVFNRKRLDDPQHWGPRANRQYFHHVYFQNGGFLLTYETAPLNSYSAVDLANILQDQESAPSPATTRKGYFTFDRNGVFQDQGIFPQTATMSDAIALNDGGALVLVTDLTNNWTRLDRIGPDAKVWTKWDSRFDNFPPRGATQMAVSADDSVIAFYIPNSVSPGVGQNMLFFDMRTNDFGNLTQQKGFITDFRMSEKTFAGDVPSAQTMTGSTFKLRDTFTINDPVQNMASFPANFAYTTVSKYAGDTTVSPPGTRSSRFFGYLRIPSDVKSIGLWNRDASQVFLGFNRVSGLGTILDAYTPGDSKSSSVSFPDAASRSIQLDHTSDNPQSDMALFYSTKTSVSATNGKQDYTVNGITSLDPATDDWKRIPANYTNPLRFTPQFLRSWNNAMAIPTGSGDRVFICFSRDIASPTFFMLNNPHGTFDYVLFGGGSHVQSSPVPAHTARGMATTPDGQRLVVAAANPNRVRFLDISTPVKSSYLQEVGHIDLPQAPTCLATRPFNRIKSKKNTYEVVADLPAGIAGIAGNSLAAVASGGIYVVGAASNVFGPASKKVLQFNPMSNSVGDRGDKLAKGVMGQSVFSYDGDLYALNGADSANVVTSWVQRWNPTTNISSSSVDVSSSGLISHWKFDETSGSTAADAAGTNTGTLSGNPTRVAGKYGNCLNFDGVDDFVNCGSDASLKFGTDDFTLALWFKTSVAEYHSSNLAWRSMVSWGDSSQTGQGRIGLHTNTYGVAGYLSGYWSNSEAIIGSGNQADGVWHHAALVRTGNSFQFYLDGSANGSAVSNIVNFNLTTFAIGKGPLSTGQGWFKGQLDDVQVYNRALSVPEITTVKNGGIANTPGGSGVICLSKTLADDGNSEIGRKWFGGTMTPYGYIFGGGCDVSNTDLNKCQVYWPHVIARYTDANNISYGLTRDLPNLPSTTHGPSFVYHKGYLYQIGGAQVGSTYIGGVKRFDFSTNTWKTLGIAGNDGDSYTDPGKWMWRYQHAACSFGDEIFIFGGAEWNTGNAVNNPVAWNPDTGVLRQLAPIPPTAGASGGTSETGEVVGAASALRTSGMTAVPCGPAIYLFGGGIDWGTGGSRQVLKYTP